MRKKVIWKLVLSLITIIIVIAAVYMHPAVQLSYALDDYSEMVCNGDSDHVTLTVYYTNPYVLSRFPWSTEFLMNHADRVITVDSGALKCNIDSLIKLRNTELQPFSGDYYDNARLCYVFQKGDGKRILEVSVNCRYSDACVNGIAVVYNPVLLEIIDPFLSEADRNILYSQGVSSDH